jgi:hypothetical protein
MIGPLYDQELAPEDEIGSYQNAQNALQKQLPGINLTHPAVVYATRLTEASILAEAANHDNMEQAELQKELGISIIKQVRSKRPIGFEQMEPQRRLGILELLTDYAKSDRERAINGNESYSLRQKASLVEVANKMCNHLVVLEPLPGPSQQQKQTTTGTQAA